MLNAEEMGITQDNVGSKRATVTIPAVKDCLELKNIWRVSWIK